MVLTKFEFDPILDLAPWVGQRQATFRFDLMNSVSGLHLGTITPIRSATLTHDTTRTIKRQLQFPLGVADTAEINVVQDRVLPYMVFPDGTEYPLGVYMFTDTSREVFTSGKLGQYTLNDEMFKVDQPLTVGYVNGPFTPTKAVSVVLGAILDGLGVNVQVEPSEFFSDQSWGIGTSRGQILEVLSVSGDYFSPWFDNNGIMQFMKAFDPADEIPDFDFDEGNAVFRSGIVETDNLLTAPNRFVVIGNQTENEQIPVVGIADVPANAPHSIANRGFVIADVQDLPALDNVQAAQMARNLSIRNTVFEQVQVTTAPDPRFDSYNVIHWQGENWLELSWSMSLVEGGQMNHLLRKVYSSV